MSRSLSPSSNLFLGPVVRTSVISPASPAALSIYPDGSERDLTPHLPSPQQHHLSGSPVSQQSFSLMLQNLFIQRNPLLEQPSQDPLHASPPRSATAVEGASPWRAADDSSPAPFGARSQSTSSSLSSDMSVASTTARPGPSGFPIFEFPVALPTPPVYRLREATTADVEGILALTAALDMTHATSFVWPAEELRERISRRDPLVVIAVAEGSDEVAGCAGIDTLGMGNKQLTVYAVGSRVAPVKATELFTFPTSYCNCRGLLIHPNHQGAGLGSRLHRTRLELLAQVAPHTPAVVLSARGTTFEEALAALGPLLQSQTNRCECDVTPQFTKDTVFEFTFQTSKGIVHLAHHRESDGWRFAGVDVSDGGPVWVTAVPIAQLVSTFPTSRRPTAAFLEPLAIPSTG